MLGATPDPRFLLVTLGFWGVAAAFVFVGRGYQELSPWVRWPGGILSAIGLLGVPIGTLLNGYILFLMFSAKGRRILSPEYAELRARTPHIEFRRSTREKVAMVLVVVVPIVAMVWYFRR